MKRLPLGQTGRDARGQGPPPVCVGMATPCTSCAFAPGLACLVTRVQQGALVVRCAPYAIGDGDERDMPGERREVPPRIRLEALRLALFVRDVNGPARASDARHPGGLPGQPRGDGAPGRIRHVGRTGGADQARLPNVLEVRGRARAVRGVFGSWVREGDVAKDRGGTGFERLIRFVVPLASHGIQAFCAGRAEPPRIAGYRADVGPGEGLRQTPTKCRLGLPRIKSYRKLTIRRRGENLGQPLVPPTPLAVRDRLDSRCVLMPAPETEQIMAPRFRITSFPDIGAVAKGDPCL